MKGTVLMVGAGRHQRRAIERARELGLRVVGVDRNAAAPGLAIADYRDDHGRVVGASEKRAVLRRRTPRERRTENTDQR